MNILYLIILFTFLFISSNCLTPKEEEETTLEKEILMPKLTHAKPKADSVIINPSLVHLVQSYPQQKLKIEGNLLIWPDGTKMPFEDSIFNKDFEQLLNQPDLAEQMQLSYPSGSKIDTPTRNFDPGRIRFEPFFLKMYGKNKEEVQQNLVKIDFLGQELYITKINNVDKKLSAIAEELKEHPEWSKYLENCGGTFNWRKIAGTNRMSMHSFGMTIDINVKYADYWRWNVSDKTENSKRKIHYKNKIPLELVKIFERHGFIWGGKWYHYDTMHFEYRPELLSKE